MFKENPNRGQMTMFDPYFTYPEYIKEILHKSWAPYFRDYIFSKINEQRFSVLYSNKASRPNTPVNILVGLLFLKELNGWTDEDVIGAFYLDYRVKFALRVTDFEEERLCINTITNFRNRLYNYELQTNEDLLQQEVDNLTAELIKISEMNTSQARQDSMMISANCKKMSRLGIIYAVNINMIKVILQTNATKLPASCQHYLEEKDKSNQLYRLKKEDLKSKIEQLLGESLDLLDAVPKNLQATQAYQNLIRLLDEQTRQTNEGVVPKGNKEISPLSLQNPSEPDATYRKKNKKASIGYVLNVVEARDKEKELSMILHYEEQQNITSDVELGKNALDAPLTGVKELSNDGAYYSAEILEKATEREIEISFSALTGRKVEGDILGVNEFVIDPTTHAVSLCPAAQKPVLSTYDAEKKLYHAKFAKETCAVCTLSPICPVKEQVRFNSLRFTEKKLQVDICRSQLGSEKHKTLSNFRAGVEGIPSVLRRGYHVDNIPVRGLLRRGVWIHSKIMSYNFKSFFTYFKKTRAAFSLATHQKLVTGSG